MIETNGLRSSRMIGVDPLDPSVGTAINVCQTTIFHFKNEANLS